MKIQNSVITEGGNVGTLRYLNINHKLIRQASIMCDHLPV